jgi:CRP-like cAMP-binding protein
MIYPELYESISQYTRVPEKEYEELELLFISKHFTGGTYLLKAGEICRSGIFVRSGCLSYFKKDKDGNEKVIDLGTQGWWMGDGESFYKKTTSQYSVKVLADAEVLMIESEKALHALKQYHFFLFYHYFALLDYRNRTDKLLGNALHASAEEKYLELISHRPTIVQMVSLHDIASFLGITPQSLSRVRKNIAERK